MFLSAVGMVPIPASPDLYYLDGPLIYHYEGGVWGHPITITAPKGLITDDASIPKFLDWIPFLDRQGLSRRPGLVHDALYSLGREDGKDFADEMLEQMCLDEGMSKTQAWIIYQGVHEFGDLSWDKDRGNGMFLPTPKIGNFIDYASYAAWKKAGSTVFS